MFILHVTVTTYLIAMLKASSFISGVKTWFLFLTLHWEENNHPQNSLQTA